MKCIAKAVPQRHRPAVALQGSRRSRDCLLGPFIALDLQVGAIDIFLMK